MKNSLTAFFASMIITASILPATTTSSHAKGATLNQLSGQGFRKCQAQGSSGYTGIVRGKSSQKFNRQGDFAPFSVRSCFQTKVECKNFVNNFPRLAKGSNDVNYSSCKRRG